MFRALSQSCPILPKTSSGARLMPGPASPSCISNCIHPPCKTMSSKMSSNRRLFLSPFCRLDDSEFSELNICAPNHWGINSSASHCTQARSLCDISDLLPLSPPYCSQRHSLFGQPQARPQASLGRDRGQARRKSSRPHRYYLLQSGRPSCQALHRTPGQAIHRPWKSRPHKQLRCCSNSRTRSPLSSCPTWPPSRGHSSRHSQGRPILG